MEEKGLKQKDLASIFGGKNRASEVLARKRPLTLSMIRALSESLQIPTDLLIHEQGSSLPDVEVDDEDDIPISMPLLVKSGFFSDEEASRFSTADIVQRYLKPRHGPLYLKRTITYGATPSTNKTNLKMWVSRVRELATATRRQRGVWRPGTITEDFLTYVARLSWSDKGPKLVQEFLAEKGIALVILPSLPSTKLDGAAMQDQDGVPIIGLTIRHDRLDNFWFTLVHELVHVWKHLPERDVAITDEDLDKNHEDDDVKESEANRLARNAFIPKSIWVRSEAYLRPTYESVQSLAAQLHISPAIVAGRLRREKTGYGVFGKLVGQRQVQKHFPEINWG
jgi:HTH-type transcriptional regulator/antitoxin HigA